jgi:hypothetical protein
MKTRLFDIKDERIMSIASVTKNMTTYKAAFFFSLYFVLSIFSISSGHALAAGDTQDIQLTKRLVAIEKNYHVVRTLGFAWTTTKPLIEHASLLIKQGKLQSAEEFLLRAKQQVEQSLAQHKKAAADWESNVPL